MSGKRREEEFYTVNFDPETFEDGRTVDDDIDHPEFDLGDVCDTVQKSNDPEAGFVLLIHEFEGQRVYGGTAADAIYNYFQLGGKKPEYNIFLNVTDAVFEGSPARKPDA